MGTLLFGPSSELAKRNASGQLIHEESLGWLHDYMKKKKLFEFKSNFEK